MARFAPSVLVILLLGGTAAAFAVTERLKLQRSPIFDTRIEHKIFSPICRCDRDRAQIRFRLRADDRVTLAVIGPGGEVVRTVVEDDPMPAGPAEFLWDGRDEAGRVVPEGSYKPSVHLAEGRKTIVLPNPIRVDVTPPRIVAFRVEPQVFSPDGDGTNDKVRIVYEISEPARALLFLGGQREVRSRARRPEGKVEWFGKVDGRPLRRGLYELALAAEDVAGNVGTRVGVPIRIRYVELAREAIRVRAQTRFGVRVRSDAKAFRWRFAGGRGAAKPGLLVLRAPRTPGRYTLFVEANGHADRARVVVVGR